MRARPLLAADWLRPVHHRDEADAWRVAAAEGLKRVSTQTGSRRFQVRVEMRDLPGLSPVRQISLAARLGAVIVMAGATLFPGQGWSQSEPVSPPSARITASTPEVCVQVDVAGYRAGHLDCAAQALQQAARMAQVRARAGMETSVPQAGAPDPAVGVASLTGARLRMGDALGASVHPQRPDRSFSTSRLTSPAGRP